MKVIFLDIDGVLNSRARWKDSQKMDPRHPSMVLDALAVWRLKQILTATGAKVVVSSTWRNILPLDQIAGLLWKFGIDKGTIIGRTPKVGRRGHEIAAWLKRHPEVTSYVILDDDSDAYNGSVDKNRVIQTTWEDGLQNGHVLIAVKSLGGREAIH